MNQTAACAYSDVAFHSEFPLITLFRLVHFRISGFLRILGGAGRLEDGGIDPDRYESYVRMLESLDERLPVWSRKCSKGQ